MFSPIGYVSLLSAFNDFKKQYAGCNLSFKTIFDIAFERDNGEWSAILAQIYSKNEVIERAFFQVIRDFEIFLFNATGDALRLDVPIFQNLVNYRHLCRDAMFDASYFDYEIDWPHYMKKIEDDKKCGRDPWLENFDILPHTSVNLFYSRDTFVIDDTQFSSIQHHFHYGFSSEAVGYPFKDSEIRALNGWTSCLKESDAKRITLERVKKAALMIMIGAVFGEEEAESIVTSHTPMEEDRSAGRPQKKRDAARAFLKYFTFENRPSWKEVVNTIREKEGLVVNERTIQRGLDELKSDKNN